MGRDTTPTPNKSIPHSLLDKSDLDGIKARSMNKRMIYLVSLVSLLVPLLAPELKAGTAKAPTRVEITCSDQ